VQLEDIVLAVVFEIFVRDALLPEYLVDGRDREFPQIVELLTGNEVHCLRVNEGISKDKRDASPAFCAALRTPVDYIGDIRINPGPCAGFLLFVAAGIEGEFHSPGGNFVVSGL